METSLTPIEPSLEERSLALRLTSSTAKEKPKGVGPKPLKSLSPKAYLICKYYMLTWSPDRISKELKCNADYVRHVLRSEPGKALIEEFKKDLDSDFLALQKKFNRVVEDSMDHPDPTIALSGANLWAKAAGKFDKGNQVNVQVNISPVDLTPYRRG